ncbi:IMPACT family protein [Deinococcus sp. KNUC1210]|uniref:IMPACT family protein n=1 Tax=Deinococcus sp. KNUC1210 TaxID=2917691 RepID=UPI001EEF93D5|nr:YigZ family protein [Deinococcus sp. KNUC1210]ULH15236.1 IMPACT family protein [Deinococcus sp. KNUC1210]
MSLTPFTTVAGLHRSDAVIENSEFLAFCTRAETPEAALAWIKALRAERPDATHVCWAYVIGAAYRFSDDGEPGGTAGQPILRAIQGQQLDQVAAAVVRYYGGTNLGTGGLARAYGGTAAECLRTAPRLEVRPRVQVSVHVPFERVSTLYHLLGGLDVERGEEVYGQDGLQLALGVYPDEVERLTQELRDATRGAGSVVTEEE